MSLGGGSCGLDYFELFPSPSFVVALNQKNVQPYVGTVLFIVLKIAWIERNLLELELSSKMDAMDFKNNKDKAVVVFMFGLLMRLLTSLSFYSFFVMKNMYISFGSIDVYGIQFN